MSNPTDENIAGTMSNTDTPNTDRFTRFDYLITVNNSETRCNLQVFWRNYKAFLYMRALSPAVAAAEEDELPACFCGDEYVTHEGNGLARGNDNEDDIDVHYAVRTSCGHVFGKSCLTVWCTSLNQSNAFTCPNCRHALFEHDLVGETRTRYYERLEWFLRAAHRLTVRAIRDMQDELGLFDEESVIAEELTSVHRAAQVVFLFDIVPMIQRYEEQGPWLHWELWEKSKLLEGLSRTLKAGAARYEEAAAAEAHDPDRFLDLTEAAQRNKCLAAAALAESECYSEAHTGELCWLQEMISDRDTERHHRRSAGDQRE